MAFGDHLCAHQHVDLAPAQSIEDRLDPVPRRGVPIQPSNAGLWETLFDGFLELLRADPEALDFGAPARSAGNGDGALEVAVMTSERALTPVLG
jgi:hypothetical protein